MVRNESEMIPLTVPRYAGGFTHRIAIDTGSTDGTQDMLRSLGFTVWDVPWNSDFSEARNALMNIASNEGFEWCIMLDADEAMFSEDVGKLLDSLPNRTKPVLYFPRYNIAGNFDRWWNRGDRDLQGRGFRLGTNAPSIQFVNRVHEIPSVCGSGIPALHSGHGEVAETPIYHYGLCKSAANIWRRSLNYAALSKSKPEPVEIPENPPALFSHLPEFAIPHPLHA